jgi:hypothetical protein
MWGKVGEKEKQKGVIADTAITPFVLEKPLWLIGNLFD